MIDHAERIKGVVKAELKTAALGDPVGFAVAPFFGMVPRTQGEPYFGAAWMFLFTLRSPLVGTGDIVLSVPIPGALPSDEVFKSVARELLEGARKKRAEDMKVTK